MAIALINGTFHKIEIKNDDDPISSRTMEPLGEMFCWHKRYSLGDYQPKEAPDEYRRVMACEFDPKLEAKLEGIDRNFDLSYSSTKYQTWSREYAEAITKAVNAVLEKHIIELPLYLHDHSGITISTGSFACRWDSGQVGFICVSKEKVRKEYGWKKLTKARIEQIQGYLKSEVETYDMELTGQVYGYVHETAPFPEDWAYLALIEAKEAERILDKYVELEPGLDWGQAESCWGFYGADVKTNGMMEHFTDELKPLLLEAA